MGLALIAMIEVAQLLHNHSRGRMPCGVRPVRHPLLLPAMKNNHAWQAMRSSTHRFSGRQGLRLAPSRCLPS
jgi:hypothetical protein